MNKLLFVVLCCLFSTSVLAGQFDHCNAIIDHGVTDISTELSAKHAVAYNYEKYCRLTSSEMTDSRVIEASASIFGFGSADAGSNTAQMRKSLDSWCKNNEKISSESSLLYQESKIISSPALAAWNSCQEAAKKQIQITLTHRSENNEFLNFDIDSTSDGTMYLTSIYQKGYTCKLSYKKDSKRFSLSMESVTMADYIDISPKEQIPINNANMQVTCQRNKPTTENIEGVGRIKYESGSVVINTTSPSFSISIPAKVADYYFTPKNTVIAFASEKCPEGWGDYEQAYGRFIRGRDKSGSKIDPTGVRANGSLQDDTFKSHNHDVNDSGHVHNMGTFSPAGNIYDSGGNRSAWAYYGAPNKTVSSSAANISIQDKGDVETRPKNVSLLYCIKK